MTFHKRNLKEIKEANEGQGQIRKESGTAQKVIFSIEDFFSKCDQIRSFLRIWSHLLKKSLRKSFIFCAVWKHSDPYVTIINLTANVNLNKLI